MRNHNHDEKPMPTRGKTMGIIPLFLGIIISVTTFLRSYPQINPDPNIMGVGMILFAGGLLIIIFAWDE
jgi:hypothetical protein